MESKRKFRVALGIITILVIILGFVFTTLYIFPQYFPFPRTNVLVPQPSIIEVTLTKTVTEKQIQTTEQSVSKVKWIDADEDAIPYLDANNYVGRWKTVEGTIVGTHKSSRAIFLKFHDPYIGYFHVIIFNDDWKNFPFQPEEYYLEKEVRVTGSIKQYKGSPYIIVESPFQIEVSYEGFDYS